MCRRRAHPAAQHLCSSLCQHCGLRPVHLHQHLASPIAAAADHKSRHQHLVQLRPSGLLSLQLSLRGDLARSEACCVVGRWLRVQLCSMGRPVSRPCELCELGAAVRLSTKMAAKPQDSSFQRSAVPDSTMQLSNVEIDMIRGETEHASKIQMFAACDLQFLPARAAQLQSPPISHTGARPAGRVHQQRA